MELLHVLRLCDSTSIPFEDLPRTMIAKEVIEYESLYKEKLGTRAHGLNHN